MYDYDDYNQCFEMAEADAVVREYQEKMKELLVKPIIDNLNTLQEENARLKKENGAVREKTCELEKLKRGFERSKEEMVRAENEKYRRTLFTIQGGDIVYVVASATKTDTCHHCNGKHKISVTILDEVKKIDCPKCDYGGKIVVNKEYFPKKMLVKTATLHLYDKNTKSELTVYAYPYGKYDCEYVEYVESSSNSYKPKFYPTIEECQAECDRLRVKWATGNSKL